MNRLAPWIFLIFMAIAITPYTNEINYNTCKTLQEVIIRETEEIAATNSDNCHELAQLYVSRGESYLLNAQYERAIEDFNQVDSYLENDIDPAMIIAFRTAFGKVVSYDNLGMQQQTEQALRDLQNIADHAGCDDCLDDRPCLGMLTPSNNLANFQDRMRLAGSAMHYKNKIVTCAYSRNRNQQNHQLQQTDQDNYSDILGPNQPPGPDWCEEIVVGTGRAMEVIAGLAPNYAVKAVLIGIIEALIVRCVKCCHTGGFWKACVAPIVRKWREWTHYKVNYLPPNSDNLPLYTREVI